ncbi:Bis(5'-nucleosyl)-tetraphosphatase [asymmetrical] [Orchesella cincta]|uniref:Bis(5'-nucleosyl)-tetraphosphatase [asymmetrical] n=1 Tax=Orchesella cincta TaxID=48709 RepID=A0A1D2NIE0_ORCCI|nr:Bis(5'-nucleosyl)-tetraphosphatase [asymmetrical] [Orchesella cincta]
MTSPVRAAGLIIFRALGQLQFEYLLLQTSYGEHHWTPPKGHLDPGEDALTAAKRETEEEAGLPPSSYEIQQGDEFPLTLEYPVKGKPKKVEYWVAKLINPDHPIKLSDEHINLAWVDLNKSKEMTHDNFHGLMTKVEEYLQANAK